MIRPDGQPTGKPVKTKYENNLRNSKSEFPGAVFEKKAWQMAAADPVQQQKGLTMIESKAHIDRQFEFNRKISPMKDSRFVNFSPEQS
jgi:hypothetical protein